MRLFISDLAAWARTRKPGFIIIPQNGQELVTDTGQEDGTIQRDYLACLDATGREELFFGYNGDDQETPITVSSYLAGLCRLFEENGVEVLVTDYCHTHTRMDSSYARNDRLSFTSFAAPDRELRVVPFYPPAPYHENGNDITSVHNVRNFLYLINTDIFADREDFIQAVAVTSYDLLITDLFYDESSFLPDEIDRLKIKKNGGRRLVIAYLSIGEAEDYRYYWQQSWSLNPPSWLLPENPDWEGNYPVRYWDKGWQEIIFGEEDSYLDRIIQAGFDGVYLDLVDAFEYFEEER